MDKNIQATQKRAVQYWFTDGLVELSGGVILLILAIYFVITALIPETTWGTLSLFVTMFLIAYAVRWVMQRIRARTTFPRTGYIAPKRSWENRRLLIICIVFSLALLGLMFYLALYHHGAVEWASALCGGILAFIFGMAGFETWLVRFFYLSAFCLLLGLVLSLGGLGNFWGVAILTISTSLVVFSYGIITRRYYLRHSQKRGEMPDEQ